MTKCPMCGHQMQDQLEICSVCNEPISRQPSTKTTQHPRLVTGLAWFFYAGIIILIALASTFADVPSRLFWSGMIVGYIVLVIAKLICLAAHSPAVTWLRCSVIADVLGTALMVGLWSLESDLKFAPGLLIVIGQLLFIFYLITLAAILGEPSLARQGTVTILTLMALVWVFIDDVVKRCYPWKPANYFEVHSPKFFGFLILLGFAVFLRFVTRLRAAAR